MPLSTFGVVRQNIQVTFTLLFILNFTCLHFCFYVFSRNIRGIIFDRLSYVYMYIIMKIYQPKSYLTLPYKVWPIPTTWPRARNTASYKSRAQQWAGVDRWTSLRTDESGVRRWRIATALSIDMNFTALNFPLPSAGRAPGLASPSPHTKRPATRGRTWNSLKISTFQICCHSVDILPW